MRASVRTLPLFGSGPAPTSAPGHAIVAKGFRPFFLLAAIFAGLAMPAWSLALTGRFHAPSYLDPISWHAHEMVFGFTAAVIAGFLLTAVGNWTQRETATGSALAGLVALWGAGRLAIGLADRLPAWTVAAVDLSFVPALALAIGRPIVLARNRRNVVVVLAVLVFWSANLAMHLDALGLVPGLRHRAALVAIDVVVLFMVLITGRVVAMFTRNATSDPRCRSLAWADRAAAVAVACVTVVDAADATAPAVKAPVFIVASLLVAGRAVHWGAGRTLRNPLLWILHVGHAWIIVGLALRAAAALTLALPDSLGMHAITAGAIGGLSLGMMARVTLGHTGRPLVLPARFSLAFGAVTVAALGRVAAPLLPPSAQLGVLVTSAMTWALAFASYAAVFAPILLAPRADGKPG